MTVARKAYGACTEKDRWLAVHALAWQGRSLGRDQVAQFERLAEERPDDWAVRVLLLGYYVMPATMHGWARSARHRHILWVVENAPEIATTGGPDMDLDPSSDGPACDQAKRLWLRHVDADGSNVTVLGNAARFFARHDSALSEVLLKRASALEPDNPEWPERLGRLYESAMQGSSGISRREDAARAFAELEKALANKATDELKRFLMLPDLAKTAVEAEELDKARAYATEMLDRTSDRGYFYWKDGSAIHYGNMVLGRLALRAGDVEKAKEHLLASGRTSGSPVLCTGGPNMTLAKELLEMGERGVVAQFLELCTSFWQTNDHRAEQWIYAIQNGGVPDFGANLTY